MNPKVSICIPTYKQTNYLRKTLESILTQKFTNYEVIITDDTPDDSVRNFIQKFKFGNKIKYFKNKNKLGTPENWNEAIRQSSGEYIKIMHHDDWFKDENSLAKFVLLLETNPNVDFAFSSSEAMNREKNFYFLHSLNKTQEKNLFDNPNILFFGNIIGAPSATIYRKKINLKYDKELKWLVDIDFYMTVLKNNKNFIYYENPLVQITADGIHQITKEVQNNIPLQIKEYLYLYKKIVGKINFIPKILFYLKFFKYPNFLNLLENRYYKINPLPIELTILVKIKTIKMYMKKIIKVIYRKIKKIISLKDKYAHISYSQCGEDIIVNFAFQQLKITKPTYLDLGAHHPKYMSNTYLLYKNGNSGVCVEPDPSLFEIIKNNRKRDICLNIGVGIDSAHKNLNFYVMSSKSLNTFCKEEADRFVKEENQIIESILQVPIISINKIISENFKNKPNFISLDIEGMDFDVLKSLDFTTYRPEIFCVETLTYTQNGGEKKLKNIIDYMIEKNYFVYSDTYINTIFIDNNAWNNRNKI